MKSLNWRTPSVAWSIVAALLVLQIGWSLSLVATQRRLSVDLAALLKGQQELAGTGERLSVDLATLVKGQQDFAGSTERQTAVLQQVVQQTAPVRLTSDDESRLRELERDLASTDRWPKDASQAEKFLERASVLIKAIPARAEAEYLPRLNPIRWASMAFVSLYPAVDKRPAQDEDVAEELHRLANAKPDDGPNELTKRLRDMADTLLAAAQEKRLQRAVADAESTTRLERRTDRDLDLGGRSDCIGGPSLDLYRAGRTALRSGEPDYRAQALPASAGVD